MGEQPLRRIGFVLANDAIARTAAIFAQDVNRRTKADFIGSVRRGLDLRTVAPGGPVTQFAGCASGAFPIALGQRPRMGVAVPVDLGVDQAEACGGDEVRVGRNFAFRQVEPATIVAFLREGLAHGNESRAAAAAKPIPYPVLSRTVLIRPLGLVQS